MSTIHLNKIYFIPYNLWKPNKNSVNGPEMNTLVTDDANL